MSPIKCERFHATLTQNSCDKYRYFNPAGCAGCSRNAIPPKACSKGCKRPVFSGDLCKSCYNTASAKKTRDARKEAGVKEVGRNGATITLNISVADATGLADVLGKIKLAIAG